MRKQKDVLIFYKINEEQESGNISSFFCLILHSLQLPVDDAENDLNINDTFNYHFVYFRRLKFRFLRTKNNA